MTEQSSPTSPTPSAFYDPESWSWRTSQASLLSAVPESLDRLPDWGTTSDGALYELRTPERLTGVRAGSASPGLPTPTANNAKESGTRRDWGGDLTAALLPTPVVNDMGAGKTVEEWDTWTDEMKAKHGNGNGHGPSLSIEAARLLPTPQALDSKIFGPNVDWKKRAENHADSVASVLMNLPLNDGNESSDDPHLTQQTIEDCDPDSSNG